ncbi:MAG: DUF5320 domain-containing protein [Spirochaetia bacterium]|nr:DUF5320 domain-containing protein [Spirochaetia bacterium]
MPGGDRTGPMGAGAITGRGAGFCAGTGMPGYANPQNRTFRGRGRGFFNPSGSYGSGFGAGFGRGLGRGFFARGMGRGFRNSFFSPLSSAGYYDVENEPKNEKEYLLSEKKFLERDLEEIKKQMELLDEELNKTEGNT